MTDAEITRLCAEAMGIRLWHEGGNQIMSGLVSTGKKYDPLHDDVQAMALVKQFRPQIDWSAGEKVWVSMGKHFVSARPDELSHAICECVAKMQKSKR